ncbi:hypothetical protein CPB85DRAFT_1411645 [Mucidula mucida]|nr:hypothetical protein CPB85DRAFT_1411645 [Mucidula mucida]
MPPSSRTATANAAASSTAAAFTLSLLSEYSHTLDSLPLDLSRNFADLRELDAVLSSQMSAITTKIHDLTKKIEDGVVSKEERLWQLTEIGEEAKGLKLGQEDKIRVACLAADNVRSHMNHLRTLAEQIPGFDAAVLNRQTTYPHVATKTFFPVASLEGGRRRRGHQGSLLVGSADPSPVKRKRAPKEDDGGSPRKERVIEAPAAKARNGGRARRIDRAGSPTESVLSVTSHAPAPITSQSRTAGSSRTNGNGNSHSGNRRSRNTTGSHRGASPQEHYANGASFDPPRREVFNVPPSTSHPSLPLPQYHPNGHVFDTHMPVVPLSGPASGGDWPMPRQLEGPGMPVARAFADPGLSISNVGNSSSHSANDPTAETEEPIEEDKKYCTCFGAGIGDMVGCDGLDCPREWFHISCVGLNHIPDGKWYCEECNAKRSTSRRGGRGGRRRVANGRVPRG